MITSRHLPIWLAVFCLGVGPAWAQQASTDDDVAKGHKLAIVVCANCHVAAPDQPSKPIMRPPAPSFAAIARRKTTTAESVETFLNTTHRGLDNPKGMSNPLLLDFQVRQVTAYLMSLRKP